jgi:hypothetical protein
MTGMASSVAGLPSFALVPAEATYLKSASQFRNLRGSLREQRGAIGLRQGSSKSRLLAEGRRTPYAGTPAFQELHGGRDVVAGAA